MAKNSVTNIAGAAAARSQIAFFFVLILLSIDSINPVKIVLHVFPQIAAWQIATISSILILYIFISELKSLLYFAVKIFFHSILSIFFRQIEVIGRDNIPTYGPVIFTGNHCNQFIDGLMIMCTCGRTISYLVAEKSWNRRVIGDLAWAMGAVPIKRAQDSAFKGSGKVSITVLAPSNDTASATLIKLRIQGHEKSLFLQDISKGAKIRIKGNIQIRITSVESNEVMNGDVPATVPAEENPVFDSNEILDYDVLPHIDQAHVFEKVMDRLASSGTIGIFPEGGSHDRTDLLPLKVGVALIAYSVLEKHGINVPIVPVGLNYYQDNSFRGTAILEYGAPVYIDLSTLKSFKEGGASKRKVCNDLLENISDSMRSVLVTTPDYQTLQVIYTARRLYQRKQLNARPSKGIDINSSSLDLTRRFAYGYKQLLLSVQGNPPKEWLEIQSRILEYQNELDYLGIEDYQVPALSVLAASEENFTKHRHVEADTVLRFFRLILLIVRIALLLLLSAIPAICLNLPIGFIANTYAEQRRKYALQNSKVKIHGNDVLLSEKVLLCIVLVPSLWLFYILLLIIKSDLDAPTIAFIAFIFPFFAYLGIVTSEAGMINLRDLRPYFMRLFPSSRTRLLCLPTIRNKLQADLRAFIRELGPMLGNLYYEKELDWREIQVKWRKNEQMMIEKESNDSIADKSKAE